MIPVSKVLDDVKRVLGGCDDTTAFSRLNDAVEILSTEAEWDPLIGYVDICSDECGYVPLPREVGTPLGVSICGRPAQAHDPMFAFHLNGPGTEWSQTGWHWHDQIPSPTALNPDPTNGSYLTASLGSSADAGKALRVFGYDTNGDWIRTIEDGVRVDGFLVPLVAGENDNTNPSAPKIARITRVQMDVMEDYVRLNRVETDGDITRIAEYLPGDENPLFRKIRISKCNECARVMYRRSVEELSRPTDMIYLHSRYAIILMAKALKKFDEDRVEDGEAYQAKAVRLLLRKQESVRVPSAPSIQIADGNLIADKGDRME